MKEASVWLLMTPLADALASALFYHSGVARREDAYTYVPFSVSYMEPDNITSPNTGWGVGSYSYLYRLNSSAPAPPPGACAAAAGFAPVDLPGNELPGGGRLPGDADNLTACAAMCCAIEGCNAFVYEPASDTTYLGCVVGLPCCFPKYSWGATAQKPPGFKIFAYNMTGVPQPPAVVDPVLGIRSSPHVHCSLPRAHTVGQASLTNHPPTPPRLSTDPTRPSPRAARWAASRRARSSCARTARCESGSL